MVLHCECCDEQELYLSLLEERKCRPLRLQHLHPRHRRRHSELFAVVKRMMEAVTKMQMSLASGESLNAVHHSYDVSLSRNVD